jgi:hypothetical protein
VARLGLTLFLMLATAAGPAWCCCTMGRMFSALPVRKPAGAGGHDCCCPGRHDANGRSTKHAGLRGKPSPVSHEPCPCKQAPRQAVLTTAAALLAAAGPNGFPATFHAEDEARLVAAAAGALHGQGPAPREPIGAPFLGCRDILRALHVLRC